MLNVGLGCVTDLLLSGGRGWGAWSVEGTGVEECVRMGAVVPVGRESWARLKTLVERIILRNVGLGLGVCDDLF